ncbi:MAG: sporulation protein YqfD, partial [Clostridia bacterium]|nr:sporulation protein YqfD [Clostridia bacterium]
MAANIWNSLAGYVIISVEGAYLERLINHITNSGIEIWDLSRQGGCIRLSVGVGGFYRLRTIAREYPCRIRILEKHGLTVALCHMGRRYVMAFGWIAA